MLKASVVAIGLVTPVDAEVAKPLIENRVDRAGVAQRTEKLFEVHPDGEILLARTGHDDRAQVAPSFAPPLPEMRFHPKPAPHRAARRRGYNRELRRTR